MPGHRGKHKSMVDSANEVRSSPRRTKRDFEDDPASSQTIKKIKISEEVKVAEPPQTSALADLPVPEEVYQSELSVQRNRVNTKISKATCDKEPQLGSHELKAKGGQKRKKKQAEAAKVEPFGDTLHIPEFEEEEDEEGGESQLGAQHKGQAENGGLLEGETTKKKARKRKTKEEKEAKAMPLASRTSGLRMFVGAHVSIAKGLQNSVTNCVHIGGNAFALFIKSQRKWDNPPLQDENRDAFRQFCTEHRYDAASHVLPHGSYLVNLARDDQDKAMQAYDAFVDDLRRCEALGIKLYNFHPGAAIQSPILEAIDRLAGQLNRALAETSTVVAVLENMAGSGSVIGSRFSDMREIISRIKPEFQSRIGICLDTCHAFAAGYDLRTPTCFKTVLEEFDNVIGMKYLKALHLNDSKAPFNSKRDLHQNIGLGFLGLRAFHNVMNESRFQNLPLILETPCDRPDPSDPTGKKTIDDKGVWAREIKLLESLIGMDASGAEFKKMETELSDQGMAERIKMQKQFDAKNDKEKKKLEKGQKTLLEMMGGGKGKKDSGGKKRSPPSSEGEDLE